VLLPAVLRAPSSCYYQLHVHLTVINCYYQLYCEHHLTGNIPKMQHCIGKTYTTACFNAITDFENNQRKLRATRKELQVINNLQGGKVVVDRPGSQDKLPVSRIPLSHNYIKS